MRNVDAIVGPATNTLLLAASSSVLALMLSVALLESYTRLPALHLARPRGLLACL